MSLSATPSRGSNPLHEPRGAPSRGPNTLHEPAPLPVATTHLVESLLFSEVVLLCARLSLPAASSALAVARRLLAPRLLARCVVAPFLLALSLLALPAAAGEKRLVILPLDTTKTSGKMTPESRASLEELLRGEAADQLAGTGWTVMTGDTTLRILTDSGIDPSKCGEGSCHLDTAKTMNVDKFISGAVQYAEGTYTASIRLIDTKSGDILASVQIEAETVKGLRKAFAEKKERFFQRSGLVEGAESVVPPASAAPSQGGAATSPARVAQGTLKVVSNPSGAKVSIDGDAAGSTPLTAKRDAGTYVVSIELPGYAPVSKQVEVAGGRSVVVSESLMQAAGYIEVGVQPEAAARGASITVDGQAAGVGKQGPFKVGKHSVRAEASGFRAAEQSVAVDNGGTAQVSLVLEALPGKLLLSVNVAAACSAGGARVQATTDGVAKLEVAAGRAQVTCVAEGYEDASTEVEVGPGKAQAVQLALKRRAAESAGAGGGSVSAKSGIEFVRLPGGALVGGNFPGTRVAPFSLARTATTVAMYGKCVAAERCAEPNTTTFCNWKKGRDNHPINCVDWHQAVAFCKWAGARLPKAEEREWAASGGEGREYPWGSQAPGRQLCWNGEGSDLGKDNRKTSCPVGSYPAGDSKHGLKDLAGNVWEWQDTDYSGGKELRGGSWYHDVATNFRASSRNQVDASSRTHNFGFRCAL